MAKDQSWLDARVDELGELNNHVLPVPLAVTKRESHWLYRLRERPRRPFYIFASRLLLTKGRRFIVVKTHESNELSGRYATEI